MGQAGRRPRAALCGGQSLGGGLWPGARAPREGGLGRVRRLTALVLLHDVHHVARGQSHLGTRALLVVSDGAVRLQDDGARDVWAEGGQGEWTRWAPPPGSSLRALRGSPGQELMSCPHPAPDRPGVVTPCVLESSGDKLGFAALHLFSTFRVPDTCRTLYTRSLSFDEVCKQPFSTLMCTGTSLVVQWLRLHALNTGSLGLIPDQGTRSHMLQLRVCMPLLCCQINTYF